METTPRSRSYTFEPPDGMRLTDAARLGLQWAEPGDTLEFVFNGIRTTYTVPDGYADLDDHVRALVDAHEENRRRADREAPPHLGDIVAYVATGTSPAAGRRREYIVASYPDPEGGEVYCVGIDPGEAAPETFYVEPRFLRVVRRASYRTVDE